MLSAKHNLQGMTLVEILVAVAIVAILFATAAPSFSDWIQNTRIRTAAEAIQNGLYLAKNEAIHRNTTAQFVSCAGNGAFWDVIAASATANTTICNTAATPGWARVQTNLGQNVASNSLVNVGQSTIAFNGLGRQVSTTDLVNAAVTPNPPVDVSIDVSNPTGGTCAAAAGPMRCLRVTVSSGGLIRMCDPALPGGTPQGC